MDKETQELFTQSCDSQKGWDLAIGEADRQIAEAESKIRGLRLSIETFREMRARNEPFPGDVAQVRHGTAA